MRTLIFCTAFVGPDQGGLGFWAARYRRWLDAIVSSGLSFEQILLVDDGSPVLPDWPDVVLVEEGGEIPRDAPIVLYHFRDNLGRPGMTDYPGWYRSFSFGVSYGKRAQFQKVVHIESDAYLVSSKAVNYFNSVSDGWTAMWTPSHGMPESGLQIICSEHIELADKFFQVGYGDRRGIPIERLIPVSKVEKSLFGDRHREFQTYVPQTADWTMQGTDSAPTEFFWWIPRAGGNAGRNGMTELLKDGATPDNGHTGLDYREFLSILDSALVPRSYFEIGTESGSSLARTRCDAVCVDPKFRISEDIWRSRRRLHFFQMTSDEFFQQYDLRQFFPGGVDLSFQDGLHFFEQLIQDFARTERFCRNNSLIILHDCLPTNRRMAERHPRIDPDDMSETSGFWAGDVWIVPIILKKYRPDLKIIYVDCPPTGLVLCTNLDPYSTVLLMQKDRILEEFSAITLDSYGIERLWSDFPTIDSRKCAADEKALISTLGLYRTA